jgi:hypothetical protein
MWHYKLSARSYPRQIHQLNLTQATTKAQKTSQVRGKMVSKYFKIYFYFLSHFHPIFCTFINTSTFNGTACFFFTFLLIIEGTTEKVLRIAMEQHVLDTNEEKQLS